jgi:putative nucleotidyltransferase with HDIG domain
MAPSAERTGSRAVTSRAMERSAALAIVTTNVQAAGLRRHMIAVEAAMRLYAAKLGEDVDAWGLAGLLHDWDWEIHPTLETHVVQGTPVLREKGVAEPVLHAILSHNEAATGVPRQTAIDYALLACDEVTGLIIAAALVRPSKDVREVEVKSIKKRWKERTFAAGVDRAHVEQATADFGRSCFDGKLEIWEHVGNVLTAMQGIAAELDLDGRLAATAG